jgi:hypothetical protein
MLKTVLAYGVALAAGAVALQWIEYQLWARAHPGTIYVALVAAAFLGLGIWIGARLFRKEPRPGAFTWPTAAPTRRSARSWACRPTP